MVLLVWSCYRGNIDTGNTNARLLADHYRQQYVGREYVGVKLVRANVPSLEVRILVSGLIDCLGVCCGEGDFWRGGSPFIIINIMLSRVLSATLC
jgi:hypothetical protein